MKYFHAIMPLLLLFACDSPTQYENWTMGTTMPTARSEMASTIVNGKIYVPGGIRFWGSTDKFEAYDIANNGWKKLPDLPEKLNHIGVASDGQKIYISGGFYNMRQTDFANTLYAFDIEKQTWETLPNMPQTRGAHFMIYRKGQLHLLGGRNHQAIWTYDIGQKKWLTNQIGDLPEKRDHITVLQNDQNLYVVGGRKKGVVQKDCWQYDFQTQKWTTFTQIPVARGGQTATFFDNKIHIIGGEDLQADRTFGVHNIYDLNTQQWSEGTALPTPRHGLVSEAYQGKWYVIGGGKKAGVKTLISAADLVEIFSF